MDISSLRYNIFGILLAAAMSIAAPSSLAAQDSIHVITVKKRAQEGNFLKKMMEGKFTIAPHYSSEMGLGTAFAYTCGAGISLIGNISTEGYALLGLDGTHYTRERRWKISYDAVYSFLPTYYWGAGYADGSYGGNRMALDKKHFRTGAQLMRVFSGVFQAGPLLGYEWVWWGSFPAGDAIVSEAFRYGAAATFDTRNSSTNPSGGVYASIVHSNYTDFRGKPHFATGITFDCYRSVWEGGILAFDFHSRFTYGAVPYIMLPTIGGPYRMRGYYSGRYRDNNAVSIQLELRQHVWEMLGVAAWAGAANLWGKYGKFDLGHTLPDYGAGIRWKLDGSTCLRFDYGFGKDGQNGFIFSINEAF